MSRKTFLSLFTLGVVLRALLIWQAPLWYDENFTYNLALLPFGKMIAATAADVHPPLSYILFWLVARLGGPAWTLRLVSLVFSVAALWLFGQVLGQRLSMSPGERVNTVAFALMALSPFQLLYAQEARMYAVLSFFVVLGVWAVLKRRWDVMAVATVGMVYTQNYGLFYAVTLWIFAAYELRAALIYKNYRLYAERLLGPTIAGLVTLVLWLPWALVIQAQAAEIDGIYWIMRPTVGSVLDLLNKLVWGITVDRTLTAPALMLTVALLALGIAATVRMRRYDVLLLAFAPLLMATAISLLWTPILLVRPLIGSAPWLYLIIAAPAAHLPRRATVRRLYVATFVLPLFAAGLVTFYRLTPHIKMNAETVAAREYLRTHATPEDIIYHTGDGSLLNYAPYLPELNHQRMPPCGDERGQLSTGTRDALGINVTALDTDTPARVWIVAAETPLQPACFTSQINALLEDAELIYPVDDDQFLTSGVWLK